MERAPRLKSGLGPRASGLGLEIPTRSSRRSPATQGGFTLVELLVTLVVTMVGLAGLFGVFTATSRGNANARETAEGLGLCQGAADEIKSFTVAELEAMPAYGVIDTAGWGPKAFHEGNVIGATGVNFVREVWARAVDPDLVWLKVTVIWASDGAALGSEGGIHDHTVALEMLRSRGEGPMP